MSVYTSVAPPELEELLRSYELGALCDYQGISDGIENTNYFVTTTTGQYVLTLFESIGFDDLPYYLELMAFLAEQGIPCPHPLADRHGHYLRAFKAKPAAFVQRLPGASTAAPNGAQCAAVGETLGRLHVAGRAFPSRREHARGPHWRRAAAKQLLPYLTPADADLLRQEISFQAQYSRSGLPWGVIHADLFRDNALFIGDQLTGVIDFYYACSSVLLYDLAVTVNDWCWSGSGLLAADRVAALLSAYHEQRPLQDRERSIWPLMLRVAALRFWLSRLQDQLFPRPGELTQSKDPDEFKRILLRHRQHSTALGDFWI